LGFQWMNQKFNFTQDNDHLLLFEGISYVAKLHEAI